LTPPAKASATDDGDLSASDIAELKLDADWVILSAYNTPRYRRRDIRLDTQAHRRRAVATY
jgi:hypothetical protein